MDGENDNSTEGVVEVLGVPFHGGFLFRDKDLISLERTGVGMVSAVAVLPREVGDHEERMEYKANGVIEPLVIAEGVVATLVGNDPYASKDAALGSPVQSPGWIK